MTRLLASGAVAICAIFLFVAASFAALPTIINGSFESGSNPGVFTFLPTGSTAITGWTVSAGTVDYIGTYWQASNGSRSVDLNGGSTGAISQTFPTVPGLTYNVTFDMSGNPFSGPTVKTMSVSAGGATAAYSYDIVANGKHPGQHEVGAEVVLVHRNISKHDPDLRQHDTISSVLLLWSRTG
jgi:choice-of-anchor C domain-containing protein